MVDKRYLEQRRQGWYAVVEVPPSKRERLGRRLRKSLKTRVLEVARVRRWEVVAEFKRQISEAGAEADTKSAVARGLELRQAMQEAREYDLARAHNDGPEDDRDGGIEELQRDLIYDEARALHESGDRARAALIYGIATGTATPIETHIETWLSEGGRAGSFKERTKGDHRRAIQRLSTWLASQHLPSTVEAVDRSVAGRFVSVALHGAGSAPKTVAKTISSLSSYWDWLRRRGYADSEKQSPWSDQSPAKAASRGRQQERPFTREEVAKLVAAAKDRTLHDFMLVAALSGMRREEIGRLRVEDCADGIFVIQAGKTAAARRRVPIHSALQQIVQARCEGKEAGTFLFNDLTSQREERTDAIGKVFGRFRQGLGIQDHGQGTRRSLVNFHSFRRFFVTEAVNAGQPPHNVSLVVGHTEGRAGMTLGRYWSGADDKALRAVVEAVEWRA